MDLSKVCFRSVMVYEFKKGVSATTCSKNICDVFGSDVITERACQIWFKKFRSGDFDLSDKPRSGRPSVIDDDVLNQMVTENPRQTSRELAERLNVDHSTVLDHLHKLTEKTYPETQYINEDIRNVKRGTCRIQRCSCDAFFRQRSKPKVEYQSHPWHWCEYCGHPPTNHAFISSFKQKNIAATINRTAFEPVEKKEALPSEPIVVSLNPADFNISDGFDSFETQFNKISDQDSSSGQEESQLKRPKKALSKISSEWPYALPELDDSLLPFLHGTCDEDDVHTLQNRFRKEIVTYLNKNNYICESNSALRRWGYDRLGRAIYEKYPNIQWTFYGSKSYNKKRPPNPWSFFIRTVSTLRKARRSRNLK